MKPLALVAAVALLGCESAPAEPTYRRDVKPILEANCSRCHGAVPRGGAPDSFRLDVHGEFAFDDGRFARGAGLLSGFMAARTHAKTMPPVAPLSDRQIETLARWAVLGEEEAEEGEPVSGNQLPEIALLEPIAIDGDGVVTARYQLGDPDFEIVTGRLEAAPAAGSAIVVSRELYSGRREIRWDTGVLDEGTYELRAVLDDGQQNETAVLDQIDVAHAGGNRAPAPELCRFSRDTVITEADLPVTFELAVIDDDPQISVELFAERAGESIPLGAIEDVTPTACDAPLALEVADTSALAAGGNWRLRLVATDGRRTREARSLPFIVGHGTAGPSFSDVVAPIFERRCSGCHGGGLAPVGGRFTELATAQLYRGFIYRYVVQSHTMPPRSAPLMVDGFEPMTAAERQIVADWILAGADTP